MVRPTPPWFQWVGGWDLGQWSSQFETPKYIWNTQMPCQWLEVNGERFRAGSSKDLGVPSSRTGCHVVGTRRWFFSFGRRRWTEISEGNIELSEKYEYRCDGCIGPEVNQHTTLLNRIVTHHKDRSVSFEADPRHAGMIIRQWGLEGSKGISSPGEKKKLSGVLATSGLPHECWENYATQVIGDDSAISRTRQSRHRWIGEVAHKKDEESNGSGF